MAFSLQQSETLFQRAQDVIPGGVNSPARAFKSVGGTPVFFRSAEGAVLADADGNHYLDYVGSWGPMILGHAHPAIVQAVQEAAARSTSFGAPTEIEIELAELIQRLVPGAGRVRMTNSGTEATMSAVRVARGFTGRNKLLKFAGNYHGHGDSFLIRAGSGALTLGQPDSPGVTPGTAQDTLLAEYNDLDSVEQAFEKHGNELAAVIVEPVAGNMGCVPPKPGFLEGLRGLCDHYGAVLIFDEVMSGFRVAPGGASERFGVTADLVCLGKIVGGGLPVGAFVGREDIMRVVAPDGPVYQAGTLSGNPLAMAAGKALLEELALHPHHYDTLEALGSRLESGLRDVLDRAGHPYQINRVGSMLTIFFTDRKVTDLASAATTDKERFRQFFHGLLREGVYFPPSPFEAAFLSTALTEQDINSTLSAAEKALAALQPSS